MTLAAAPTARPLYLGHAGGHKRVAHTTEALVVTNTQGQTLRYPLARISRVVSSPVVDWAGSALALCLKHGITITWADAKGHTLGSASPTPPSSAHPANALALLLEEPHGPTAYADWLRSRRMAVLTHWGKTSPHPISPAHWENTKREWVYLNQLAPHLPPALLPHCHAWVVAQLHSSHLPTQLLDTHAAPVPLAHDLAQMLWAQMNLCTGPLADNTHTERELVDLFERWHAPNGAALHLHLGALLRLAQQHPNT